MENKYKAKLKRRGEELYIKYFFNPDNVINEIVKQYDNKERINENDCVCVFNISKDNLPQIHELIKYYPNKLKELKYIDINIINNLYSQYGETMEIMNNTLSYRNVRGKICRSATQRAKEYNIPYNIHSEDIILVKMCPLLNVPLKYGNNVPTDFSPSLDKIIPSLGYIKGNVQVISLLANQMKSSANDEQLITFAKNILKIYDIS